MFSAAESGFSKSVFFFVSNWFQMNKSRLNIKLHKYNLLQWYAKLLNKMFLKLLEFKVLFLCKDNTLSSSFTRPHPGFVKSCLQSWHQPICWLYVSLCCCSSPEIYLKTTEAGNGEQVVLLCKKPDEDGQNKDDLKLTNEEQSFICCWFHYYYFLW